MDHRCLPNSSIGLAIALQKPSLIYIYLAKTNASLVFEPSGVRGSPSGHCLYNTYYKRMKTMDQSGVANISLVLAI